MNPLSPSTGERSASCIRGDRRGPFCIRFQNGDYHSRLFSNQPAILLIGSGLQYQSPRLLVSDIEEHKPLLIRNQRIHDIGTLHFHLQIALHRENTHFQHPSSIRFWNVLYQHSLLNGILVHERCYSFKYSTDHLRNGGRESSQSSLSFILQQMGYNLYKVKTWYSGNPTKQNPVHMSNKHPSLIEQQITG